MTQTSQVRLDASSQDFIDAKQHVYGLAHNVCLNGEEQRALLNELHDAENQLIANGWSGQTIIKTLLKVIADKLNDR